MLPVGTGRVVYVRRDAGQTYICLADVDAPAELVRVPRDGAWSLLLSPRGDTIAVMCSRKGDPALTCYVADISSWLPYRARTPVDDSDWRPIGQGVMSMPYQWNDSSTKLRGDWFTVGPRLTTSGDLSFLSSPELVDVSVSSGEVTFPSESNVALELASLSERPCMAPDFHRFAILHPEPKVLPPGEEEGPVLTLVDTRSNKVVSVWSPYTSWPKAGAWSPDSDMLALWTTNEKLLLVRHPFSPSPETEVLWPKPSEPAE